MGIVIDALAIMFGGVFGSKLNKSGKENYRTLGIGIMMICFVGFFENMYRVHGESIISENLIIVLFAYIAGSKLGEMIRLDERLSNLGKTNNTSLNAFVDAVLFFGIGGMQISGPIALAINGDNSQLLIKSFVDLPFALAFGAACGKIVALSALPVAAMQVLIAATAYFSAAFLSPEMTAQLCAMGYVLLFFSGFNLVTEGKHKISNVNMLPGIFLVVLFNILRDLVERIL